MHTGRQSLPWVDSQHQDSDGWLVLQSRLETERDGGGADRHKEPTGEHEQQPGGEVSLGRAGLGPP